MKECKFGNLICNSVSYSGDKYQIISPVNNEVISEISLASKYEIELALSFMNDNNSLPNKKHILEFISRLKDQIIKKRSTIFYYTCLETGFIAEDSNEMVDGAIEYLNDFAKYAISDENIDKIIHHSYSTINARKIRIIERPYKCIAAIVPQNATLILGLVIIVSALFSGSKVILRPSLQSGVTGALLAEIIHDSDPPESCITVLNCSAKDFLDVCYSSKNIELIHYIGSNRYAIPVFIESFRAGKNCLIDGQGNGMLYVDETFPIEDAVQLVTKGSTRYNGGTCTSINGVIVKDVIYSLFKEALEDAFNSLQLGNPLDTQTHIGPLFSDKHALLLQKDINEIENVQVLCGGKVKGAYFSPAIIEDVHINDKIVREGLFGPALWIKKVHEENIWDWFNINKYPLSDTLLSANNDLIQSFVLKSRAGRICLNADPSIESMFEPWGGYPPSGLNPVSEWIKKYRQVIQLDGKLQDIMTVDMEVKRI